MKKILSLFAAVLFAGSVMAADYTLTFPKMTSGTNYNSYTGAHTTTCDGITWSVYGNQSLDGDILRIGGKNTSNTDRTITSSAPLTIPVKSVTINHQGIGNGKNSEITVNSLKLEVADNSSFTNADVITKTGLDLASAGTVEFTPTSGTSWAANSYYRVTMNYKISGSNNCYLTIKTIVFEEYTTTPTIKAVPATLDLGAWEKADGEYASKTITVKGSNLTGEVALSFMGALFSVTPNRINPTDGSIDKEVTVKVALGWIENASYDLHASSLATTPDFEEKTILTATAKIVAPVVDCATGRTAGLAVSGNNVPFAGGKEFKLSGYVTKIEAAYDDTYHNVSFWIADTEDGGEVLEAFRAACAKAADAPKVGDYVEVTGQLSQYNGTPQFMAACTYKAATPTAIDNAAVEGKAVKELRNGQVVILKGEKAFNILGQEIR